MSEASFYGENFTLVSVSFHIFITYVSPRPSKAGYATVLLSLCCLTSLVIAVAMQGGPKNLAQLFCTP